jgi:hypothetical protein
MRTNLIQGDPSQLVLTFDELLRRTPFAERMREILHLLEQNYRSPVDMEFTLHLTSDGGEPKLRITILQCRPQSHLLPTETAQVPLDLPKDDIVFSTHFVVPQGYLEKIDYVLFVDPEKYFALQTMDQRRGCPSGG